jgi:hypothetical protein
MRDADICIFVLDQTREKSIVTNHRRFLRRTPIFYDLIEMFLLSLGIFVGNNE